jgi:hypothetical protein
MGAGKLLDETQSVRHRNNDSLDFRFENLYVVDDGPNPRPEIDAIVPGYIYPVDKEYRLRAGMSDRDFVKYWRGPPPSGSSYEPGLGLAKKSDFQIAGLNELRARFVYMPDTGDLRRIRCDAHKFGQVGGWVGSGPRTRRIKSYGELYHRARVSYMLGHDVVLPKDVRVLHRDGDQDNYRLENLCLAPAYLVPGQVHLCEPDGNLSPGVDGMGFVREYLRTHPPRRGN